MLQTVFSMEETGVSDCLQYVGDSVFQTVFSMRETGVSDCLQYEGDWCFRLSSV